VAFSPPNDPNTLKRFPNLTVPLFGIIVPTSISTSSMWYLGAAETKNNELAGDITNPFWLTRVPCEMKIVGAGRRNTCAECPGLASIGIPVHEILGNGLL